MIESVLVKRNATVKTKITVKSLLSALFVAMAVILPQIVHAALGQPGGVQWLPMYLPVILGACLLGWRYGLLVGVCSPLVSFLITLAFGSPMPVATRLPYMVAELAVIALISGAFSKKIAENSLTAFASVFLAFVGGRLAFLAIAAVFQSVSPLSASMVWAQIQSGLMGMALQVLVLPLIIMGLNRLLLKDKK